MASIRQIRSGSWRAELYRQGVRASACFDTREEAFQWALEEERKLGRRVRQRPEVIDTAPKQLVVRYPPSRPLVDPHRLMRIKKAQVCGVYFLWLGNELVYIGQSRNVPYRVSTHAQRIMFDSYSVIRCAPEELNELESLYIYHFKPSRQMREDGTMRTPLQVIDGAHIQAGEVMAGGSVPKGHSPVSNVSDQSGGACMVSAG